MQGVEGAIYSSFKIRGLLKINGMLKVTQEHNADILDVAKEIKVSHPYKWQKIEEKWNEIYPNLQLNVNVQAEIQRTYDIIESRGGE